MKVNSLYLLILFAGVLVCVDSSLAQHYPYRGWRPVMPSAGRPIMIRPPNRANPDDIMAESIVRQASNRLDCNGLGAMVREVSNSLMEAASMPSEPMPPSWPGDPSAARRRSLERIRQRLRSPGFLRALWPRLTEAYQGCGRQCFEEGDAIGQLSGAGYCAASIGLNGLPDPSFLLQPLLPLCGNLQATGCQNGFYRAASEIPGCQNFASGDYYTAFQHTVSQDCFMSP